MRLSTHAPVLVGALALLLGDRPSGAMPSSLLPPDILRHLRQHVSREQIEETRAMLLAIPRHPASAGFERAAEIVAERARAVGLSNVRLLRFPSETPSWDVHRAELWILDPAPLKIADSDAVVQYSRSADREAEIVFVGMGTTESDYRERDVRGKIVLAHGPPRAVEPLALERYGAVGIISFPPEDLFSPSSPEERDAWGRLDPQRIGSEGFAFTISASSGRALQERLGRGERLRARVLLRADIRRPAQVAMVTAEIPGSGAARDHDILVLAPLDHLPPETEEGAAESATLLEIARVLQTLRRRGEIAPPRRTIRFWWVTEIESTMRYVGAHPEEMRRLLGALVLGCTRDRRADLLISPQPMWRGTFLDDAIRSLARALFASGDEREILTRYSHTSARFPDQLLLAMGGIDVPALGLSASEVKALPQLAALGAACGLFLANATAHDLPRLLAEGRRGALERVGEAEARALHEIARGTRETIHARFARAYHIVQRAYEREGRIVASLARLVPSERERATTLLASESDFVWNLFALQEAAVQLLTRQYERACRVLGIAPKELEPDAEEQRLYRLVPIRTVAPGPDFRAWFAYVSPRLGPEISMLVKNLIDGERRLAQIFWFALAESEHVTTADIEAFIAEGVVRGWVRVHERP